MNCVHSSYSNWLPVVEIKYKTLKTRAYSAAHGLFVFIAKSHKKIKTYVHLCKESLNIKTDLNKSCFFSAKKLLLKKIINNSNIDYDSYSTVDT